MTRVDPPRATGSGGVGWREKREGEEGEMANTHGVRGKNCI